MSKQQKQISEASATILELMRDGIQAVIAGRIDEFEINPYYKRTDLCTINISPSVVQHYLESLGWEKGDLETNGWQYDWWLPFTKDGKSFTAHGSGYYGGFHFSKTEA